MISTITDAQESAVTWFEKGMQTKALSERIKCFEQAIAADSNLIEAHYQLGKTYLLANRIEPAQIIIKRALMKFQNELTDEMMTRFVLELTTVYRKQKQYATAKKYLNQVQKITQDTVMLGLIYYELGSICIFLTEFNEAIQHLETGLKLLPQMQDKFRKAIALARSEGKIEVWYRQANQFFENEQWHDALSMFEKVADIAPDYKDTQQKLSFIRQKLTTALKDNDLDAIYASGITQLLKKDFKNAAISFQRIVDIDPQFKDALKKLEIAQSNIAPVDSTAQHLDQLYEKGLQLMAQKDWVGAILQFEIILGLDPHYLDVSMLKLLSEKELQKTDETVVEATPPPNSVSPNDLIADVVADSQSFFDYYYQTGLQKLREKQWREAVAAFEIAHSYCPSADSLYEKLTYARRHLIDAAPVRYDESQFTVVQGHRWNPYLIILIIILFVVALIIIYHLRKR